MTEQTESLSEVLGKIAEDKKVEADKAQKVAAKQSKDEKATAKKSGVKSGVKSDEPAVSTRILFGVDPFQKLYSEYDQGNGELVQAMQIDRVGCLVKSTTVNDGLVGETMVFVPGVKVVDVRTGDKVTGRKLTHF